MLDSYQREVDYLRVSVTDRCNLRCIYCMPPEGIKSLPHLEILRLEEIEAIVQAAATVGFKKLRFTGGEPLVRKGIANLVRAVNDIPGIDDIAMTTNGIELASCAKELKEAGLKRINISLDTMQPERYREITGGGSLANALEGIEAALTWGFHPVKINVVVMRDFNLDEVAELARLSITKPLHIRFIELMPIGATVTRFFWQFVPTTEVEKQLKSSLGMLQTTKCPEGAGPARYYSLPDAVGTVGFISPLSNQFCSYCNRLRLTADGNLRPCLHNGREIDIKTPLRQGKAGMPELACLIKQAVALKPGRHYLAEGCTNFSPCQKIMSEIGG